MTSDESNCAVKFTKEVSEQFLRNDSVYAVDDEYPQMSTRKMMSKFLKVFISDLEVFERKGEQFEEEISEFMKAILKIALETNEEEHCEMVVAKQDDLHALRQRVRDNRNDLHKLAQSVEVLSEDVQARSEEEFSKTLVFLQEHIYAAHRNTKIAMRIAQDCVDQMHASLVALNKTIEKKMRYNFEKLVG